MKLRPAVILDLYKGQRELPIGFKTTFFHLEPSTSSIQEIAQSRIRLPVEE